MRFFSLLILLILTPFSLRPQSFGELKNKLLDNRYSFQFSYQEGGVFGTNDFVSGKNATGVPIDRHKALSIRLAKQTTGEKSWEQLYGYPRYGIGLFIVDFRSKEIGQPVSCYGFLTGPFFMIGSFSLNYDLAIGLTFGWKDYDPIKNPYNNAIGSSVNSHIEGGIGAEMKLSPRMTAGVGFGLTHFSNGGLVPPNLGINTSFWKYSIRYEMYDGEAIRAKHEIVRHKPSVEWALSAYTGFENIGIPVEYDHKHKQPTITVYNTGLIGTGHLRIGYKSKFGAGLSVGYNGIINPQFMNYADTVYLNRRLNFKRLEFTVFPSYQLVFNKFALIIQAGFYVFRNQLIISSPVFYQRLAFQYDFTDHIFAAIQLRARNFNTAEIIEWSMGYRF